MAFNTNRPAHTIKHSACRLCTLQTYLLKPVVIVQELFACSAATWLKAIVKDEIFFYDRDECPVLGL